MNIVFKLSTAESVEYCFSITDPIQVSFGAYSVEFCGFPNLTKLPYYVQVLYEYILSTGKTECCFSLYTSPPKKLLELSDTKTLKDNGLVVPTVVFVEESDQDVGDLLFPPDTLKV